MKLMRPLILILICTLVFANPSMANTDSSDVDIVVLPSQAEEDIQIHSDSVVLMSMENGDILFSKGAHNRLYPASTTKILTGILALEHGDIDEIVTVGNEANLCTSDGSRAGLDIGEEISLKNLLYGLMLPSGNDAAYTIAVHIGRKFAADPNLSIDDSVKAFVGLMNSKAQELGATGSHFANPDGYHHDSHYTTAHDMALIAKNAMEHPGFREIVGTSLVTMDDWASLHDPEAEEKEIRYWWNSNSLIQPESKFYYPHATGIKTGYTSHAKHCLVSSASNGGLELITVVLGCTKQGKWAETTALFDYGFDNFETYKPFQENQQVEILNIEREDYEDDKDWIGILVNNPIIMIIPKGKALNIEKEIKWSPDVLIKEEDGKELLSIKPPVSKSQKVGTIDLKLGDESLGTFDLIASKSVELAEPKPMQASDKILEGIGSPWIGVWIKANFWKIVGIGLIICSIFLILVVRASANRRRRRHYVYRRRY